MPIGGPFLADKAEGRQVVAQDANASFRRATSRGERRGIGRRLAQCTKEIDLYGRTERRRALMGVQRIEHCAGIGRIRV